MASKGKNIWVRQGPDRWNLLIYGLIEGQSVNFCFSVPIAAAFGTSRFGFPGDKGNRWLRAEVVGVKRDPEVDPDCHGVYAWIVDILLDNDYHDCPAAQRFSLTVTMRYDTHDRKGVVLSWKIKQPETKPF